MKDLKQYVTEEILKGTPKEAILVNAVIMIETEYPDIEQSDKEIFTHTGFTGKYNLHIGAMNPESHYELYSFKWKEKTYVIYPYYANWWKDYVCAGWIWTVSKEVPLKKEE